MDNLDILYESKEINDYFYNKLKNSVITSLISEEDYPGFLQDIKLMSSWGVQSKQDEKLALSILFHVNDIIMEIKDSQYDLPPYVLNALYLELFNNKELLKTNNIFCTVAEAATKVGIPLSDPAKKCEPQYKAAYPQGYAGDNIRPIYDTQRWMQATRDIYLRTNIQGIPYIQALEQVTNDWDKMEALNFKHWLKFYSEGNHLKYPKLARNKMTIQNKVAQYFNENGSFIPMAELPAPEVQQQRPQPDNLSKRDKIEMQRARILSRLSSAEKILSSLDGQDFAGAEQELMLKLLQDLKRKVQTTNKISLNSSIFEDLIYRAGNYMQESGSKNGRNFFFKIAQMSPELDLGSDLEMSAPSSGNAKKDTKQAFRELKELMHDGVYDSNDDPDEKKNLSEPTSDKKEADIEPPKSTDLPPLPPAQGSWDIIVTAQDLGALNEEVPIQSAEHAPPQDKPRQHRPKQEIGREELIAPKAPPMQNSQQMRGVPNAQPQVSSEDLEVTEEDISQQPKDDTDDVIEDALQNITIHDAVARLEVLTGIFKKREVPRQLEILDIMLNTLGVSSFFPELGEAMAKSLESSQYISTRLEDVLNKLKGSVPSKDGTEWTTKTQEYSPETVQVQKGLEGQEQKEKELKEKRKQRDNAKLQGEHKTEIGEQAQELQQPAKLQQAQPLPNLR